MARPSLSTLFPYTTLFRSGRLIQNEDQRFFGECLGNFDHLHLSHAKVFYDGMWGNIQLILGQNFPCIGIRSEEHTLNSSHSQISYAVFCLKKKLELLEEHR